MSEQEDFFFELESIGEGDVRVKLSQGVWANRRKSWAEGWLQSRMDLGLKARAALDLSLAADSNATARETNLILHDTLHVAKSAKGAAWVAAAAAWVAAFVAMLSAVVVCIQTKCY
ncbi:hypothetical protein [Rugamonas sp. DEMB1]|uniref:hypothetical protein n=1 Tax=Rugamonas sp. DEMB1 TaxID=3039386 RepID=UPI002449A632|nr:hypothetical protein [Rugamonas sp. DEMB1]WGG49632.1 hypothetical protein QC826_24385 [Rugamonas sp. DEMB1]